MNKEMDSQLAKFLGWSDVQHNDLGSVIGMRPGTDRLQHIPTPTSEFSDTIAVVQKLNADGYMLTLEQTRNSSGEIVFDATFLKEGDNSTYRYYMHPNPIVAIAGAALAVADVGCCPDSVEGGEEQRPIICENGMLDLGGDTIPVSFIRRVSAIRTEKFISGNFAYILNISIEGADTKATYVYDTRCEAIAARESVIKAMAKYYNTTISGKA